MVWERRLYWIAIVLSFGGVLFAFIADSPAFALFDAAMGAWFTYCLLDMPKR